VTRPVKAELVVVAGRIREAVHAIGRQSDAADAIGVTVQQVQRYVSGRSRAPAAVLTRLADASGFRFEFLISGEGPRFRDAQAPVIDRTAPSPDEMSAVLNSERHRMLERLEDLREAVYRAELRLVQSERAARVAGVASEVAYTALDRLYRDEPTAYTTRADYEAYSLRIGRARSTWESARDAADRAERIVRERTDSVTRASDALATYLKQRQLQAAQSVSSTERRGSVGPGPATGEETRP